MKSFTISDYFQYLITPLKIESLVILSAVTSVIVSFIENNVGISLGLFSLYFIFALLDMATGIYKNVIKDKEPFSSSSFIKKILSVGFMLLFVTTATQLNSYLLTMEIPNIILDQFQSVVIYTVNLIKVFLIVGFFIYEITSLRENFEKIGWDKLVKAIDLFLMPMIWLKEKLQKNIKEENNAI